MFGTSLGVYLEQGHPGRARSRAPHPCDQRAPTSRLVQGRHRRRRLLRRDRLSPRQERTPDYLFGGSVRDDGPLPEVVSDMLEVQRKLREIIWGEDDEDLIGFCIVVGTMLHGIATGNCLPASVPLVCVDINQATVTKLMDRGSFQSMGIITDVGLFIRELAEQLAPERGPCRRRRARARRAARARGRGRAASSEAEQALGEDVCQRRGSRPHRARRTLARPASRCRRPCEGRSA